jgi:hypothetical protein
MSETRTALTIGVISKLLNCPIHKIEYLIRAREIQPMERAGNLRVFSSDVLDVLKKELEGRFIPRQKWEPMRTKLLTKEEQQ